MKRLLDGTTAVFQLDAKSGKPFGRPLVTYSPYLPYSGRATGYRDPMHDAVSYAHGAVSDSYRKTHDSSALVVGVRIRANGKWVQPDGAWSHASFVRFGQQWSW